MSSNALFTFFTEFLTVAIHTILYERTIYPQATFLSARAYDFPVRQSRHPGVCAWVQDAVNAVRDELADGRVKSVALVIFSPQQRPLERFVFDVNLIPMVSAVDRDIPVGLDDHEPADEEEPEEDEDDDEQEQDGEEEDYESGSDEAPSVVDLAEQFRGAMARLAVCGSALKPLPKGCSYTIAIQLKENSEPPVAHPQPWIPAEPPLHRQSGVSVGLGVNHQIERGSGSVQTTAVRTIGAGEMIFEVWIEESQEKTKLDATSNTV